MSRSDDELRRQIARLRRLVSSPTGLDQDFLVPVTSESEFMVGSVVSPLQRAHTELPSGLIVPFAAVAEAQPIDQVKLYLIAEEVLGESVPLEAVLRGIAQTPLEVAMQWCAVWLGRLRGPGSKQREVDNLFATSHLAEPHRTRVLNLLRDPQRVLVTPQGLFCVAKLALSLSATRGRPENPEDKDMALALIGIMEHLGSDALDEIDDDDEEIVIDGTPGPLGREVIANQLANSNRQEAGRWAAFEECWYVLPTQLADHPRIMDLPQAFEDATGVSLNDLIVVCAAMWASAANGHPHLADSTFAGLGWTADRLDGVLDLICGAPDQLRDEMREEMRTYGLAWSQRTLERFPVVRWESGEFTVIDPELLVDRASGVWPLFDALRCLEEAGDSRAVSKLRGAYDHIIEHYARGIMRGLVWSGPAQARNVSSMRTTFVALTERGIRSPTWLSTTAMRGSLQTRPRLDSKP